MQVIAFKETWEKARTYFDAYNEQQVLGLSNSGRPVYDLKEKLRKEHRELCFSMLRLYAKQLFSYELLNWDSNLPPFHTNSQALGKVLDCDPKTIRTLMGRLLKAKVILEKESKGRRHNYVLHFNPKVMVCCRGAFQGHEMRRFAAQSKELENESLDSEIRKECPVLDTDFSNKNNQDCGNVENRIAEKNDEGCAEVNSTIPNLQEDKKSQAKDTSLQIPDSAVGSDPHARPLLDHGRFDDYYERLLQLILPALYPRLKFMAASQIERIRLYLAIEFAQRKPVEYEKLYQQLRLRVMLAEGYLRRDSNRFIPIPARYFSHQNPMGFAKTADWLAEMNGSTARMQEYRDRYTTLMKTFGSLMKHIGDYLNDPGMESYTAGRQIVGKRYGSLVRAYDYVILSKLHSQTVNTDNEQ